MHIVYYTGAVTGSGHIVLGISVYNAFQRANTHVRFTLLSSAPFATLCDKFGVDHVEIKMEDEKELSHSRYRYSELYNALSELDPDVLIVDMTWYMVHNFIDTLHCKKVYHCIQLPETAFSIPLPGNRMVFDPGQYDIAVKVEPFDISLPLQQVEPLIIRNRDEIMPREQALAKLGLSGEKPVCFFAFNGKPGEYESRKKTYSYLEEEGYDMVYTTNYRGGIFPLADYYNAADLLICGAGYNAFWEAIYFEKEAIFIPMPRRFEDQRKRVEECSDYRSTENGADRLVRMVLGL